MWYNSTSQQSQALDLPTMDLARLHGIDPRGVHARMAENIGKAHNILLQAIISAREKMAEIMRKNLLFRHVRRLA